MRRLVQEKQKAEELRKKGYTYQEILQEVPVAKSSLSLWLKDLPLTESEKKVLKRRGDSNISRGRIKAAAANKTSRERKEKDYFLECRKGFELYKHDSLFHTGIALYWAEGAKRSNMFHFMNSDEKMIELILVWLEKYTTYKRRDVGFRLYLHKPYRHHGWEDWWAKKLGVGRAQFKKTIVKPNASLVKKRPNYKGCVRVEVPRSSALLLKVKFWITMSFDYLNQR